ncbi:MAG TPA: carotenoid biosynthesis protein [Candidatus Angelobacter sp.]|jgi:putative membrane protein
MNMATAVATSKVRRSPDGQTLLLILIVSYAVAVMLPLTGISRASPFTVGPQIIAPALFALVHGSKVYGWRGVLTLAAICLLVCNIVENLGVITGIPFGTYYFTGAMGPRLFHVPLTMGLAYFAIGYFSWTLALLIRNPMENRLNKSNVVVVPLLAGCIVVVWDCAFEPEWSTVSRYWIWQHGGPYFGVPLTNFLGWFLTNLVILQSFAFYIAKQRTAFASLPRTYWRLSLFSYMLAILTNIIGSIVRFRHPPIYDPTGTQWSSVFISFTSILISILGMGGFAFLAWQNLRKTPSL